MRLVIAQCQVDYAGRLTAHLPMAKRLILVKADGSVSIHADDRAYKPLNWMSPPCIDSARPADRAGDRLPRCGRSGAGTATPCRSPWPRSSTTPSTTWASIPGLQKDGVEAHLQALLAEHPETLGAGWSLVRREYLTPIGPVDLLCRDAAGGYVAVEVKRRGEIDGVEQLTRYLELMRRDPLLGASGAIFAAQQIKPQARTLAEDRGIRCVVLDYDVLRGMDDPSSRLF